MTETSDSALLKRWHGGDRAAAEELIDRYSDIVHRFLVPRAGEQTDDFLQQVFLALLESGGRFQGKSSVKTYLLSIARHQLHSHYRQRRRHPTVEATPPSLADLKTSPSAVAARHQAHQYLHVALQSLPLDQQITLELIYWQQLPPSEVAEVLEIPANTVYTRARRAREHLQRALHELDPAIPTEKLEDLFDRTGQASRAAPRGEPA